VQQHFITCDIGVASVITVLQERREIIRNEALLMSRALVSSNADIQKILAFQGIFEILFNIIQQENGIGGGIVVQDCLAVIETLLRFNVSNQNYFREISLPASLPPLLGFPSPPPPRDQPVPQEFNLQYWDQQRATNAGAVVNIMKMVAGGKGASTQVIDHHLSTTLPE
jgi:hypothetical protein